MKILLKRNHPGSKFLWISEVYALGFYLTSNILENSLSNELILKIKYSNISEIILPLVDFILLPIQDKDLPFLHLLFFITDLGMPIPPLELTGYLWIPLVG